MSNEKEVYDITIIGAGPVGLFAAFYAGIRKAKTKIIDSLPQIGGQLMALYPDKYIYDIPGFEAIKAKDLIANLEKQIAPFEHTTCLEEEVVTITKENDWLKIETNQKIHYSKSVILAMGNGSFQPRKLQLQNCEDFEGTNIHYAITNLEQFAGKNVVIAGGGDSAIDWALMLEPIAKEVHLVHRRNEFRGHEHSVDKLQQSSVNIHTPFTIEDLVIENGLFKGVQIHEVKSDHKKILIADDLMVNYGFTSSLGHLKEWGLDVSRQTIPVQSDMSTIVPGIYAAGDICHYLGKIKLIATGFGEAPTAVNNALHFIQPNMRLQPAHSTSLFESDSHKNT